MILTEKQLKYQLNHQENFTNMNILLVKIYYYLINNKIIEQARFTYSPLGKAFEKQIKTIEDQGKKQIDALKVLEPKEETKPIEDKSNKQSKAKAIFSDLINKRKDLIKELHDKVDYKNLNFKYVDKKNNDVIFYGYKDSKERFSAIKDNQIKFDDAIKKQSEFLNKLSIIKIGGKNREQKKGINNHEKSYISREEV